MEMDFTYSNEKFLVKFQKNDYWLYFLESRKYELKDYFFKIHISATVYNYKEIFKVVLPILFEKKVQFKIINGEKHLEKINTGEYGYSQIGKIITIYPENETELMYLLEELYRKTKGYSSIEIPSDFRYKNSEVVYYRYGEFIDSGGKDKRVKTIPSDIYNPILDYSIKRYRGIPEEYHLIKILSARGKSKVYMAIDKTDFSVVIIKEGIDKGEINSLGYDGFDNVYYEKEIFNELKEFNFFPRVKTYFYSSNNFCIVEEFIKGDTLSEIMLEKKYDLDIPRILLEILYNRSEEHTSELQSPAMISYAVFCLKKEALSAAEVALAEAALADTALAAEKESGIRSSRTTGTWIVSSSPSSSTGTGWGTAVNKLRRRTAPERGPATLAWGLLAAPAAPAEAAEAGSLAEAAEAP